MAELVRSTSIPIACACSHAEAAGAEEERQEELDWGSIGLPGRREENGHAREEDNAVHGGACASEHDVMAAGTDRGTPTYLIACPAELDLAVGRGGGGMDDAMVLEVGRPAVA